MMSLFAVGGANSAIPEMHSVAVDVNHWLTDKQFTDVYAIAQLSPGPNVLIVTLIGYSVAGILGALVATLAMCVPTALLALTVSRFLSRSSQSRWPSIIQTALERLHSGAQLRPDRRCRPRHGRGRGAGVCDQTQSALDAGGRRLPRLCWPDRVRKSAGSEACGSRLECSLFRV
jgi:hypothetical protein